MMLKIGLIGITAVLLALLFKKEKGEIALLIILAAGMIIFVNSLACVQSIVDFMKRLMGQLPLDGSYLTLLIKMLGITYVADFAASVCRESGYASVAGQVELFAKLSIIVLSLPELMYLVDVLENFCR